MRALRFGSALALAATVALGACTAHPDNGSLAADDTQTSLLAREFDQQLDYALTEMIASAEIGPDGKIFFHRMLSDRRFLEPDSGRYWQISAEGYEDFRSRSLWNRTLELSGRKAWAEPLYHSSEQFPNEPLTIVERTVRLPGSDVEWQFVVAKAGVGEPN